ncbi:hypothetical protein L1887_37862 [Cichorium endivia]|nr:hypothetical protein L1887_37862 [Cichorium endivia]
MFDMFPFPSNGENLARGDSKISSSSKDNYRNAGDTLEAENKDFTVLFPSLRVLKFADLRRATKNFSQDLLLGKGRFGEVFLGWVDKNTFAPSTEGDEIAVAVKKYNQGLPEWQMVGEHPSLSSSWLSSQTSLRWITPCFPSYCNSKSLGASINKKVGKLNKRRLNMRPSTMATLRRTAFSGSGEQWLSPANKNKTGDGDV